MLTEFLDKARDEISYQLENLFGYGYDLNAVEKREKKLFEIREYLENNGVTIRTEDVTSINPYGNLMDEFTSQKNFYFIHITQQFSKKETLNLIDNIRRFSIGMSYAGWKGNEAHSFEFKISGDQNLVDSFYNNLDKLREDAFKRQELEYRISNSIHIDFNGLFHVFDPLFRTSRYLGAWDSKKDLKEPRISVRDYGYW